MPHYQTPVKPLALAIALASSQAYGITCTQDFNVTSQTELDAALNSIINSCGSAANPYTIGLADSLSGSSVVINDSIVLNTIELEISGPEAANVTLKLEESPSQAESRVANIRIVESGHLSLKDLTLDGDSSAEVDDYRVTALLHLESGKLDLDNVLLQNYYSHDDGAIQSSGTTMISDSTFQGITSDDPGSIVSADSGSLIIEDSVFDGNHVGDSAGVIAAFESATLTITDSEFTNNSTDNNGGVLYAANSTVNIDGSTFSNNSSTKSTGKGGALYIEQSSLVINDSVFTGNKASNNSNGEGGAIYIYDQSGTELTRTISKSSFINNTATNGGAISVLGDNNGIAGDINITDTLFEGNTASNSEVGSGGAIDLHTENSNGLTVTIDRSLFHNNDADDHAGAINFEDSSGSTDVFIISNSTLSNNTSRSSGGIRYSGGYGNGTTIANSTIINNTSSIANSGSALYAQGVTAGADIEITNSIISGNTGGAGQVCANEASHNFSYKSSFVSNDDSGSNCLNNTADEASQVGTLANTLDPLLATLADNGGFTKTYSPQRGSSVIDAGDVNFTSDGTDQRGLQRVINSRVDMGAVEFAGSVPALSQIDISELSEMEITENTAVDINLSDYFSSTDGGDLTYAVTGLPAGLSVNAETGAISGIVTEAGTFTLSIRIENDYGLFLNKEVEVIVLAEPEVEEPEAEVKETETEAETSSSSSSGGPINPWFAALIAMIAFVRVGTRVKR